MIVRYAKARVRGLSPEYTAYRDRVVAAGGSIASASAVQAALDVLATTPAIVQWLDARHGLGPAWYSICGAAVDARRGGYGSAVDGNDVTRSNERTLAGGAWLGGTTPELGPGDDYTWGMHYYLNNPGPIYAIFWGNRYGNSRYPGSNVWNYFSDGNYWRSYFDGDTSLYPSPSYYQQWAWIWIVKSGTTVTAYDHANNVLGSVACSLIGELPLGIAGGTDSSGIATSQLRYQAFVRAASALSAAERAAIQAA